MDATDVDMEIFKFDVFKYTKRQNRMRVNLKLTFTLILGQCTKLTWIQLEGLLTWESVLQMVKSLTHLTMDQKYHPLSLYLSKNSMCGLQQDPNTTSTILLEKLKARVEVVEEIGGGIGVDSKLVKDELVSYLKDIAMDPADVKTAHTIETKRRVRER